MAGKKRVEAAEILAPDPFMERANDYARWIENNLRLVIAGVVAALALLGGILFVMHRGERSAAEATAALTEAMDQYKKAATPDPAQAGTSTQTPSKADVDAAVNALKKVESEYSGSAAAKLAGLYRADLARKSGQFDEAKTLYARYTEEVDREDPLLFLALEGAGLSAENQKQVDEALGFYQKMLELPGGFYKDHALRNIARVQEAKGDRAAAKTTYQRLIDEVPDSKLRGFAEGRVAALP